MDTKKLRQKILDLAIHGKLVPQDPNDEPASVLLERIRAEKEQLIKEGKIKAPKKSKTACDTSHYGKEGPWELPEGWVWCRIDGLGDVITGTTPTKSDVLNYGDDYPFYKPTDLDNGINTFTAGDNLSLYGYNKARKLPINSVLVTCIGATIGKTGLIRKAGSCNQQINAIIPHVFVDPEYLYYCCTSRYGQDTIISNASATTLPILNKSKFSELLFPLPPVAEQQRILEAIRHCLEIIDGIGDKSVELLKLVQATKTKILDLAIHGKLVPQNPSDEPAIELLKRINPAFKPSYNLHYEEHLPTGWICATYGMLNQHKNRSINPMDSPKEQFELYSVPIYETGCPEYLSGKEIGSTKQAVEKGDVLLCKINPHLNRAWVVEHHNPKLRCIASSEWLIFQSDALCPDYARMFFMSPSFRTLMLSNVSGVGGSLMRARASAVDGYPIWVPPINEQKRMVKVVKAYYKVLDEIVAGLS